MNKFVIKVIVLLAIMLGMSNYMMYIMTGKLPFDIGSLKAPDLSLEMPDLEDLNPSKLTGSSSGKSTIYKWVDENGVTVYSESPPPQQIESESITIDPNANIVQATKITEKEKSEVTKPSMPSGPIYSPGNVKKLVEDAKNVENLLNERHERQKKAMGD